MAMRPRFRRPQERVFRVTLTVHQLDSIPVIHRELYVHWSCRRAQPSNGRTPAQPVDAVGNWVRWNVTNEFSVTIPSEPSDPTLLQRTVLLITLRSDRRARWGSNASTFDVEGRLGIDISELTTMGPVSNNYLVQESPFNTTLKLSIRVSHQAGDKIFRTHGDLFSSNRRPLEDRSTSAIDTNNHNGCSNASVDTAGFSDSLSAPQTSVSSFPAVVNSHTPTISGNASSTALITQPAHLTPSTSASTLCPLPEYASTSSMLTSTAFSSSTSFPSVSARSYKPLGDVTPATVQDLNCNASDNANLGTEDSNSSSSVVEMNIPNPDVVQRAVCQQMRRRRLREHWPDHVIASREEAESAVNEVFGIICAADGIVTTSGKELRHHGSISFDGVS